ncbi:MAG: YcxB family protein [Bacteroidia bacterium]|nr:YcxB family protein [Bacteroidia bacterium]
MEITIKYTDAARACVAVNKATWEMYMQKSLYMVYVGPGIGFLLLAFGIYDFNGYFSIGNTKRNFHFFFWVGLFLFVTYSLHLIRVLKAKKIFFKSSEESVLRHSNGTNEILIKIDDEFLFYQSSHLTQKMSWSLITRYAFYKNFIFIYTGDSTLVSMFIDRTIITENDYADLITLLKKHEVKYG